MGDDREVARTQVSRRVIESLQEAKTYDTWRWAFRSSGLPLCQLQVIWFEMDEALKELPRQQQSYMSDFFLGVGTAAHTVTQRWLGRLNLLFGNWRCPQCHALRELHLGIPKCHHHEHPVEMVYEEFAFDDLPTGHCDGLLKLWDMTPGDQDYVLLEVKTTQRNKLEGICAGDFAFNYKLQTSVYASKLRARGYNIVDCMFLFVPRDYPRDLKTVWFYPAPGRSDLIHRNMIEEYEVVLRSIKEKKFGSISGICGVEEDAKKCPYRVNCFSPSACKIFNEKAERCFRSPLDAGDFPVFP